MSQYTVNLSKKASKQLKNAPKDMRGRLQSAIDALGRDPRPVGCEKMEGVDNQWRVREGDWRIVYSIYDRQLEVEVIDVDLRKNIYRRW